MAFGFPHDRIWEYCYDCEVFQAGKMAKGRAIAECRICRREVARRYMCHNCQTMSFESDQPPRGKRQPAIQNTNIDALHCAGCLSKPRGKKMITHNCPALGIDFLTTRPDCLFCYQQTSESVVAKKNGSDPVKPPLAKPGIMSIECPNLRCRRMIPSDSLFCPSCGLKIKRCGEVGCGLPLHPTSLFCPHCGVPVTNAENHYRVPTGL